MLNLQFEIVNIFLISVFRQITYYFELLNPIIRAYPVSTNPIILGKALVIKVLTISMCSKGVFLKIEVELVLRLLIL